MTGDGKAQITPDGKVQVNGEIIAQLQVARVANLDRLTKMGDGQFAFEGRDPRTLIEAPSIRPGFVESSGVDPIKTMMQIVAATKAVTGNANLIRYHDQLLDRAVNTLGRVG